jgi:hypothetical protein
MSSEDQENYREQILSVRNHCMTSMLLCLDKQQRLVFVLGAIFNVKSPVAARILGVTATNFRQQLSRAKQDLFQFMNNRCGLINSSNPCRCSKKAKGMVLEGKVSSESRTLIPSVTKSIQAIASINNHKLDELMEGKYFSLFRSMPYEDFNDADKLIESLIFDADLKKLFHLN